MMMEKTKILKTEYFGVVSFHNNQKQTLKKLVTECRNCQVIFPVIQAEKCCVGCVQVGCVAPGLVDSPDVWA